MAYDVQWLIPNQIMLFRYYGEITEEELRESLLNGIELSSKSDYPIVHSISDVTQTTKVVPLMRTMKVIKEVGSGGATSDGWSIVVGQKDPVLKFATNVTRQFLKMRQASFDTCAEAIAYLKEMDVALDWVAADQTLMDELLNRD